MDSANLTIKSLLFPEELHWDGIMEQLLCPSIPDLFSISEISLNWQLFGNNTTNQFWNSKSDSSLHHIDFPDITSNAPIITKVSTPTDINHAASTVLHTTVLTQLTPPQSPPTTDQGSSQHRTSVRLNNFNDGISYQQFALASPTHSYSSATSTNESQNFDGWNGNNTSEVASTFSQIVDEIVSTRAKELTDWNDETRSSSSFLPTTALEQLEESWFLNSSSSSSSYSGADSPLNSSKTNGNQTESPCILKKHTRSYGRGIEDRKKRKKEQNKNAASRYRQKKKNEMEHILRDEQELLLRNENLKTILANRNREAKYLKSLIREFYKKK